MLGKDTARLPVRRVNGASDERDEDLVAVEEPLEIRLEYVADGRRTRENISVTMRTPGPDVELALGFLFAERIIDGFADVRECRHSGPSGGKRESRNVVTVALEEGVSFDAARLERHFYTTSSCGVCGKTSLEALEVAGCPALPAGRPRLSPEVVHSLPETLRKTQSVFDRTGGLHAAALFDADGRLLDVREDVGRHNALDKLVGAQLMKGALPLSEHVILVSGRVSFELAQKTLRAGAPVLAAVSAPSSLAVELAAEFGLTLLGFVRDGRFNVYAGDARIAERAAAAST